MIFQKEESVFSLARARASALSSDITTLFEEFYCFLLLAGLLREGEGVEGVHVNMMPLSSKEFGMPSGSYNSQLATMIGKGLQSRFLALKTHHQISEHELKILMLLDRIFDANSAWTRGLLGIDLYGVALARSFSPSMATIARYVSVMFGHDKFADVTSVPKLYLSVLGNIHLSAEETVILGTPELPYGSRLGATTEVTALWALLSAQLETLSSGYYPGDTLGDMLANLKFMTEPCEFEGSIPAPVYASSLYMQRIIGLDGDNPVAPAAAFYQSFLYGTTEERVLSRGALLNYLLDVMVRKAGNTVFDLFSSNSYYSNMRYGLWIANKTPERPTILKFALEALEPDDVDSDIAPTVDDTSTDPSTDDSDLDPTVSDPAEDPSLAVPPPASGVNIIGLISFDKTGEGVDEGLYRDAVVALNDKLKADDSINVTPDVREALDYWVNGFLYLTAISSTKSYIVALKLQRYLKQFKHEKD